MNDSINRKGAINAVCTVLYPDADKMNNAKQVLKEMPSAQPESHDKRTETHSCDTISRQAAIDALEEDEQREFWDGVDRIIAANIIRRLPPAQPKPCEDAVSRADVLECFADLYDTFEDCSKGIINELHRKFEDLRTLPSAQSDRSLWFCIGEICVDESKGFISAGRAVEKIRELLRETERREDE